jgi:glycosyltransferase involved in cell wall biosynthesis
MLERIDRNLFEPHIWALRGDLRGMDPLVRAAGLETQWLTEAAWVTPAALARLFARIRQERPDIMYGLTGIPNIWGRPFANILRVPVVLTGWRMLAEKQYETLLWRLSNRIICNAHALKAHIVARHGADPGRIAVIHNGVDTDHFTPQWEKRAPAPVILSVARFVKIKDPMTLVKAFRAVVERIPEAVSAMVGEGPLKPQVERYVREHGLGDHVRIYPGTTDLRPRLAEASAFVLCSLSEGLPNTALEAMACGLPVVATRVGGVPEIVTDGVTGFLVPPGNPEALAEALINTLEDQSAARAMGAAARERAVRDHSLDVMVRKTERVFLEAIDEVRRGRGRPLFQPSCV